MGLLMTMHSGFSQAPEPRREYDVNQEYPLKWGQYAKFMAESPEVPPPANPCSSSSDVIELD